MGKSYDNAGVIEETQKMQVYPSNKALRDLYRKLFDQVDCVDPAPWRIVSEREIETWAEGKPEEFTRRKKLEALTVSIINRALLEGSLTVGYLADNRLVQLPAWIWGSDDIENTLFMSSLKVEALLPDEWWSLSGAELYVDKTAFDNWLSTVDWKNSGHSSSLSEPHDIKNKPNHLTSRALPSTSYVSIAETIGWLAFGIALEKDRLVDAIDTGLLGAKAEASLKDAVLRLVDAAAGEKVRVVGKYCENYLGPDNLARAVSERIDPIKFLDFACFDGRYGGLEYGSGLSWETNNNSLGVIYSNRSDGYRDVLVRREDLASAFPRPSDRQKKQIKRPTQLKGRVSATKLHAFWQGLAGQRDAMSQDVLLELARAQFPDNFISRDRIRELTGPRKRGKKPLSGKELAK